MLFLAPTIVTEFKKITIFLNEPIMASFCLFSPFQNVTIQIQIDKSVSKWCAWDSNPGWQDGRST